MLVVLKHARSKRLLDLLVRHADVMIRKRFGRLPRPAKARIQAAEPGELASWLERILDARTVDDIFTEIG